MVAGMVADLAGMVVLEVVMAAVTAMDRAMDRATGLATDMAKIAADTAIRMIARATKTQTLRMKRRGVQAFHTRPARTIRDRISQTETV